MKPTLRALCFASLLLLAAGAGAQVPDEEWVSYRDAYRSMLWFEKYGKAKRFIQVHFQVAPRDKGASLDGLKLSLNSKAGSLNLPLDAAGRAVFPLSKAAYDENAALMLNQKVAAYRFRPRVSIQTRTDGVYELADLRAACEEVLNYQRYADPASVQGRKCVGVRLSYMRTVTVAPRLKAGGRETALGVAEGAAFPDDLVENFRVANLRFAELPDKGQVLSPAMPLAIAALIE
ncbi:hypothetical protein [Massilia sp. TS11]|uniref:hypothetical protein n=1 Tax=Massilia sp. TS11 TaxID=2908003 RepID=UPI001EDBB426|nr:hypothetical protein [Massilia sp. TS11]MCG2585554.1 hypothetical protein [Massilia sp. TS11]